VAEVSKGWHEILHKVVQAQITASETCRTIFQEVYLRARGDRAAEVIVNLIANTAPQQGLLIQAELDSGTYPTGLRVSDKELALVNLIPDGFHGDWNYTIAPKRRQN
jgi:hypothetical protein